MQRQFLLLLACFVFSFPVFAQENTPTETPRVPNLIGLSVPEAHRQINERGFVFDPVVLSTSTGNAEANRIIDQSPSAGEALEERAVVSITVYRENNVELIWLTDEWNSQAFTMVNLSDEQIFVESLEFRSADGTRRLSAANFPDFLRENRQCIQLWTFNETNGFRLPECQFLQGGGILSVTNESQQFWRTGETFTVWQAGLLRGECAIEAGTCQIWLSALEIAEDFSPYLYIRYNQNELIIDNRAENQWLPLSEISLAALRPLNDLREWDTVNFQEDFAFLAPNQCLRFSTGEESRLLDGCSVMAERVVSDRDAFWRENFIVHSLRDGDVQKTCPAAVSNEENLCLLLR